MVNKLKYLVKVIFFSFPLRSPGMKSAIKENVGEREHS